MILFKKTFRDLKINKAANIAATILIGISLMIYAMMSNVNESLNISKDEFYKETKFADVFADVRGYPRDRISSLENIDGVGEIQGRISKDFVVYENNKNGKKTNIESKYLRILGSGDNLCTYIIESGRAPKNNFEVVLDPKFAQANNYNIGDKIQIINSGKITDITITGIGRGAENIFAMRAVSDMMPDYNTFGVAYTNIEVMDSLLGEANYNSIVFSLEEKYSFQNIKSNLEDILKPYGIINLIEAEDQTSNAFLIQELESITKMSKVMPMMFLLVSGAIVYIMLKRMVEMQRNQIGILKAFGFSDFQITINYIGYVGIMGFVGALTGSILGTSISGFMMDMYSEFFNMPFILGKADVKYILLSIAIGLVFSTVTGILGGREALILAPSEAMRPKGPTEFNKKMKIEEVGFIKNSLTMTGKIGLRNIGRNKGRAIFIVMGVSFTAAICAMPWNMVAEMLPMLYDRYEYVEKYDLKISLNSFVNKHTAVGLLENENIKKVEAIVEIPVKLRKENMEKSTMMIGVPTDSMLYTPVDSKNNKITMKEGQVIITNNIAEEIGAKVGDEIFISSPMAKYPNDEKSITISSIEMQLVGTNGYMEIETLSDIFGFKGGANTLILAADELSAIKIKEKYVDSPTVNSITIADSLLQKIESMMSLMIIMIVYMGIIAIITGFAIIYNSTITVISEREREMTSMMVVGMSEREVFDIISFEQWVLSLLGIVLGAPLTKLMLVSVMKLVDADLFSMPANFDFKIYILSIGITVISIAIGQFAAFKKIKKLNLVDALKSNE